MIELEKQAMAHKKICTAAVSFFILRDLQSREWRFEELSGTNTRDYA